jgi:uncharacterized protein (TIGR02246 family)
MTTDADKAALAGLTQQVVVSWAKQDADAFADVFVADGTMILAGVYCEGRDEVRSFMAQAFEGKYRGTQVTGKPISIRFLGPDAAILLSLGGVLEAGQTEVADGSAIRASWLAARQADGQWKLVAYQNTPRYDAASGSSAGGRAA